MKKIFKLKALSVILMAVLLLSLLSLVSCDGKNKPYEWAMSYDESIVWNEDREYCIYDIPVGYKVDFNPDYYFDEYIDIDDGFSDYDIKSYARDGEVIAVDKGYSGYDYYVTVTGGNSIDALIAGKYAKVRLYYRGEIADMYRYTLESLDALYGSDATSVEIDVTELQDATRYDIRTYDSTGCVYYVHGALYEHEGRTWYISYDKLSNEFFDANGNFSYRRGTVTMYAIDNTVMDAEIEKAKDNLADLDQSWIREKDDINPKPERKKMDPEIRARLTFWVTYALLAFALPAWPLVVGFKNASSWKHGYGKHWRVVSIGAGVWAFLGAIIAIFLLT